jgi:hypothetical protein
MMQVGQKLYAQPGAEGAPESWSCETKTDDWVQDAEVENDDKNTRV